MKKNICLLFTILHFNSYGSILDTCDNSTKIVKSSHRDSNIDLAKEFIKKNYPNAPSVKIAIIDSGFDQKQSHYFKNSIKVKRPFRSIQNLLYNFKTGYKLDQSEPLSKDKAGHGTAVSSIIGAKDIGANENVDITLYKVSLDFKEINYIKKNNNNSKIALVNIIKNACDQGNKIINMSISSLFDEAGIHKYENFPLKNTTFGQYLYDKGCSVFISSGNDGLNSNKTINLSSPSLIRVGSTSRLKEISNFSSASHIRSSGEDIVVVNQSKELTKDAKQCKDQDKYLISGTSFSAPLIAGGQSLLISILKTSNHYNALTNNKKIDLLNHLLFSASENDLYDAYKSVILADHWIKQQNQNVPTITQFKSIFNNFKNSQTCSKNIKCSIKSLSCINKLRSEYAICGNKKLPPLLETVIKLNNFEWIVNLLNSTNQKEEETIKIKKRFKNQVIALYRNIELETSQALSYAKVISKIYPDTLRIANRRLIDKDLEKVIASGSNGVIAANFLIDFAKRGLLNSSHINRLTIKTSTSSHLYASLATALSNSSAPVDNFTGLLEHIIDKDRQVVFKSIDSSSRTPDQKKQLKTMYEKDLKYKMDKAIFGSKVNREGQEEAVRKFPDELSLYSPFNQGSLALAIQNNEALSKELRYSTIIKLLNIVKDREELFVPLIFPLVYLNLDFTTKEKFIIYSEVLRLNSLKNRGYFLSFEAKIKKDAELFKLLKNDIQAHRARL